MKKIKVLVVFALVLCFMLSGCEQSKKGFANGPDIAQIRSICELATLECYYHNVAKDTKETDFFLQKERKYWIEYTGIARIGIDMNKVEMEINGKDVKVTLPNAELLGITILEKDLNEESFIKEEDGWIKNKITADDQTSALDRAQDDMSESVKNNKSLLRNAQERAKELIENYIKNLGELSNVDYQIKWVYEDASDTNSGENTENQQPVGEN